jgi:predicted kinase
MELVVFVGLQGSGKSTLYRERYAGTHALVSKDLLRSGGNRDERQRRRIEEALGAGRSVVVDNTNVRREDRAKLLALARAHGARAVCVYFLPDLAASLERNRRREGRARVPDVALYAAAKRLEPPAAAEGFDEVLAARALEGGGFEVGPGAT